jgi:Domain of unknown function (DUF4365)
MNLNDKKEHFSYAYFRAVVCAAGFCVYRPEVDKDSIDLGIAMDGPGQTTRSPRLETQVKCTAAGELADDRLSFQLKLKNYDDLRFENFLVPRILVVITVPENEDDWIAQTDRELALRHCGYWVSLRGKPAYAGAAVDPKVTIHLPRNQPFSVLEVRRLMEMVGREEKP